MEQEVACEGALEELRRRFPRVWMVVSDARGELRQASLRSYMARIGVTRSVFGEREPTLEEMVGVMSTYLSGDSGGVEPRPSLIDGAGQGLFATRDFGAGELLCVYRGKKVPLAASMRGEAGSSDYRMGGFGLFSVDATDAPEVLARYINDHADVRCLSVKFVKLVREYTALVVALRDIAAGEELFVSYGEVYWRARGGLLGGKGDSEDKVS